MKALVWDDESLGAKYHVRGRFPPTSHEAQWPSAREKLVEAVADADEALLEKYLEGAADQPRRRSAARSAQRHARDEGRAVLCGAAFKNKGVQPLLDAVVDYLPSPLDMPPVEGIDPKREASSTRPRTTRRRSARSRSRS